MNVTFYSFSKRVNSTARPSGGTSYSVILKEGCSITHPSIRLTWTGGGAPASYNYAYIPDFARYYWVKNWQYDQRQWTADLTVDALASYKSQIGSSTQYVVRSSAEYDGDVIDTLYPAKSHPIYKNTSQTFWGVPASFQNQVLCISTMGRRGWQEYYIMDGFQYAQVSSHIFASNFWDGYQFGDVTGEIVKALKQPENSVVGVTWLPISSTDIANVGVSTQDFMFGYYYCPGTYKTISPRASISFSRTILIDPHPDQVDRGNYVAGNVYTTRDLFIPGVGTISLDCDKLIDADSVRVDVTLNLSSGYATFSIYAVMGTLANRIYTANAMVGVNFGYGTNRSDVLGTVMGIMDAGMSYQENNGVGMAKGIADAAKSAFPKTTILSTSGAIGGYLAPMVLSQTFYSQTEMDNADRGRPLCKVKQVSTLPGYMVCSEPHISAPATDEELQAIEGYMAGGFFFE